MGEEGEVEAFLHKLKTLSSDIYYFREDNILSSTVVRNGMLDRSEALRIAKAHSGSTNVTAPFQALKVGEAKNLSHDELDMITNNFSDCLGRVGYVTLFRGWMDVGEQVREVTVKTWNFVFPAFHGCVDYPRYFHDEIVLLERSKLKSCPFLVKLIGFCFEKKLAVVYDLTFKRILSDSLACAEFGWKERMKVATNYALFLKTLTVEKVDLSWSAGDIMIDEEYNIKLVNFRVYDGTCDGDTVSDYTLIEKAYIFEFGILLLELIMKKYRAWDRDYQAESYIILKGKGSSVVNETLEIDADTGTEITKLIGSCVCMQPAQRPHIDHVIDELKRIVGRCPAGSDESV